MSAGVSLIDNLITCVYRAISSFSCSVEPRSPGHRWDPHMRAASIKLVQAGQAPVRSAAVKRLWRTDTHLNGTSSVTSCSLMMQREKGTHTNAGMERSGNRGVGCLRLLSAKLTESLYFFSVRLWMSFRESVWRKISIIHATLCPLCL